MWPGSGHLHPNGGFFHPHFPSRPAHCLLVCYGMRRTRMHPQCPLPFFFFSDSSPLLAPKRVKMIPVWELTPTAVTTIRPDPSMTCVPASEREEGREIFLWFGFGVLCLRAIPRSTQGTMPCWGLNPNFLHSNHVLAHGVSELFLFLFFNYLDILWCEIENAK